MGDLTSLLKTNFSEISLNDEVVVTSSFGIFSAASIFAAKSFLGDSFTVVFVDTGWHFGETLSHMSMLRDVIGFDLHIIGDALTNDEFISEHGRLWEEGSAGIERYNFLRKVVPLNEYLNAKKPDFWISGIRAEQSLERSNMEVARKLDMGTVKLSPFFGCSRRDIFDYMVYHNLPFHPFHDLGYESVGDIHTTPTIDELLSGVSRKNGFSRECGIHTKIE